MISPELVAFAIRSAIRLGQAGRDAYEQKARDRDFVMPDVLEVEFDPLGDAERIFRDDPDQRPRVTDGDLAEFWDQERNRALSAPAARLALIQAGEAVRQSKLGPGDRNSWRDFRVVEERTAGFVLRQWKEGDNPPPPLARIGLALAEVALDFVGSNPSVFGVGGNGEKLISAMAGNLVELLPNPDDPSNWPEVHFAERTLAIVMHAGLRTLSDHPEYLADEEHLHDLVRNVTKPLLERFNGDPAHQPSWILLRDTLFGPVSSAAFETLVDHQCALFGGRFAPDKAIGAVTTAVLREATTGGLFTLVSKQGLVRVYKAALNVAVERPELFVTGQDDEERLGRELLSGVAAALHSTETPFSKDTLAEIAAVAIDTGGRYATARIGGETLWYRVAGRSLERFLAGVKQGVESGDPNAFGRLFSRGQAVELARIVLGQASKTPHMLVGANAGAEVQAIVAALTKAMASDDDLLLDPEDWREIAAVAAEQAARNPTRLFKLDVTDPGEQLAAKIIEGMLDSAATDLRTRGRAMGSVLFGHTLREAIIVTLTAAAGNSVTFGKRLGAVVALANRINQFVAEHPGTYGATEWLVIYRKLITEVAESLDAATLSDDTIAARLVA